MPIVADDLKFLAAERMSDSDDAGGYPSATVVLDNAENLVFPDIASGDRIGGRTHLRKIHAAVRSPDGDALLAARAYISEPYADDSASVSILVTGVSSDDRYAAADALYTSAQQDINTNLRLFQNYNEGESTITVYALANQAAPWIKRLPAVGEIIYLEDDTQLARQYVRVISVSEYKSATYTSGTITVQPPLQFQFRGGWSDNANYLSPTQIYLTRAIPMAYGVYGITPLAAAVTAGSTTVRLQTLSAPIAPTITDTVTARWQSTSGLATLAVTATDSVTQAATLPTGTALEDVSVSYMDGSVWTEITGADTPAKFTTAGDAFVVTLDESPFITSSVALSFSAPSSATNITLRAGIEIIPGTVVITAYRADTGARLDATDNGSGVLIGSVLSGTVDYASGVVALSSSTAVNVFTTNAAYGCIRSGQYITQGVNLTPVSTLRIQASGAVVDGSFSFSASRADTGAAITATDDGNGGISSTDGITGTIVGSVVTLNFQNPIYSSSARASYRYQSTGGQSATGANVTTTSVTGTFNAAVTAGAVTVTAVDDASGNSISTTDDGLGAFNGSGITGTVNYSTGALVLSFADPVRYAGIRAASTARAAPSKILWEYPSAAATGTTLSMRLPTQVQAGSVQISALRAADSVLVRATDDGSGGISGDATGSIVYSSGAVAIEFDDEVTLSTVTAAYYYSTASDANSAVAGGMDVVRLPASKSFPLIRVGDIAVIHSADSESLPNPAVVETAYPLDRSDVDRIWLEDADGAQLPASAYRTDLVAGTVTLNTGVDVSDYAQPLRAWTEVYDEGVATAVNTREKTVRLNRPLSRGYASGYLSAAVNIGDMTAGVTVPFEQQAWTSVWQNTPVGNPVAAQYNGTQYPITVRNDGAISERWRISFATSGTVDIIGEHVGIIATGLSIMNAIAPLNPYTRQPYFTIPAQGWGLGWIAGYQLRFNTTGADFPLWMIRCVQPGLDVPAGTRDRFRLALIGDIDA